MGALASITGALGTALTAVNTVKSIGNLVTGFSSEDAYRKALIAKNDQALAQLQERQKQGEEQAASDIALQKQQLAATAQADEQRRRLALKRAVAKQKTLFSAQGIAPSGGSADAVLLGLFDESEEEKKQSEQLNAIKTGALESSLEQQRQKNLLEAAQLQARNNLERIIYGS